MKIIAVVSAIVAALVVLSTAACGSTTIIKEVPAPSPAATRASPTPTATSAPSSSATTRAPAPQGTYSPPAAPPPTLAGVVEPSTIGIGAHNEIVGISWQSWGGETANGTGQQLVDDCNPTCANGNSSYETVTVTVAQLQGGAYTQITEADQNGNPVNAQYGPSVSTFIQTASLGPHRSFCSAWPSCH